MGGFKSVVVDGLGLVFYHCWLVRGDGIGVEIVAGLLWTWSVGIRVLRPGHGYSLPIQQILKYQTQIQSALQQHTTLFIMYQSSNPLEIQSQLRIFSHNEIRVLPLDQKILQTSIQKIKTEYLRAHVGYSTRIHLYRLPICSHHKLDFVEDGMLLGEVIREFGPIGFTFNNTQYFEEHDYYQQPVYSRPPSKDTIETVVQICQSNFFVHENYRVQQDTRIGFFSDICSRYGRNLYVQYFNTRIGLAEFASGSVVGGTIGKFVDRMGRLTITVDSVDVGAHGRGNEEEGEGISCFRNLQKINSDSPIDQKFYFRLCLIDENSESRQKRYYAISRNCKVEYLRYLLEVLFKQKIVLYKENIKEQLNQQFIKQEKLITALVRKEKKKLLTLETPIQNCQIVGHIGSLATNTLQVLIIQNSSILHRISISSSNSSASLCLHSLMKTQLPATPTSQLDEDLFFVKGSYLLSYSISISMIKLKHYNFSGQLLMLKIFPWYHEIYEIEFYVVDLFCVRLKNDKKKVRVFFIYDPEGYVEVPVCEKFFAARAGNNVYSDDSGVFATMNQWAESVEVFSLKDKCRLVEIRLNNYKQLTQVLFTEQPEGQGVELLNRTVILNFGNKELALYSLFKGELLVNILCEKGMSSFLCLDKSIYACAGTQLRKLYYLDSKSPQDPNQNFKIFPKWAEPVHIPDKAAIILPSQGGKILIKESILSFSSLSKFYIFDS